MSDENLYTPQDLIEMRKKILDGYEPKDEELSRMLKSLAFQRSNTTAAGSKAKKPVKAINLDTLFD